MEHRVDPIHSQKSHNLLILLKSLNKLTPRKTSTKIKFKSESSNYERFSFTVRNKKSHDED